MRCEHVRAKRVIVNADREQVVTADGLLDFSSVGAHSHVDSLVVTWVFVDEVSNDGGSELRLACVSVAFQDDQVSFCHWTEQVDSEVPADQLLLVDPSTELNLGKGARQTHFNRLSALGCEIAINRVVLTPLQSGDLLRHLFHGCVLIRRTLREQ